MDINLEYYKIFYYVGKHGSITAAAEQLHISQPAVSQAIKNLEEMLGSSVFVRTAKGVRLTTEGEVLYRYVEKAYEGLQLGEKKFREMLGLENGEIRIGASDMTLRYYILPYLETFHERYPNIRVSVTNAPTPKTLKHIKDGLIDFGVVSTPIKAAENYMVIPARSIQDIFIVGEKYRACSERILPYCELNQLPFICLEGQTSSKYYISEFLEANGVHLKPEIELATSDMLVMFAEKGFGCACVVEDFAREALDGGRLFRLNFEKPIPPREICVVAEKNTPMSAAAKKFLEYLQK